MTFAELLEAILSGDLSSFNDDDLATHEATLLAEFQARREAGVRGADAIAEMGQIADAADALRNEARTRLDTAAREAEELAALDARLNPPAPVEEPATTLEAVGPDPDPDAPAEPDGEPDPEVEGELVGVAASATPAPVVTNVRPRPAPLAALSGDTPAPAARRNQMVVMGRSPELPPPTRREVAEAWIAADRMIGMAPYSINHPVVTLRGEYPEGRHLVVGDTTGNQATLDRLFGPEALTAGLICGPATPYYQLPEISVASRPFHDGLSSLSVSDRGKITFNRPFAFSDFSDAVGMWTDADNEDDQAEKNCDTIECGSSVTEEVIAFTRCLTINNMQARYSPEYVAQAINRTAVHWAIQSEKYFLDRVKAASVAVDINTAPLGFLADFAYQLAVASESYRNSDRMLETATLVAALPRWAIAAAAGDMARTQHQYAEMLRFTRAQLEAIAANLNVRLIFYIDTPTTGTSQQFGTQGVGPLADYPARMQWGLWHEGAHVVLDGGPDITFGLVRDTASNLRNTYQTFGESFEGYAFMGVKSWWITQTICPNGAYSAPIDIVDEVCGGPSSPGS